MSNALISPPLREDAILSQVNQSHADASGWLESVVVLPEVGSSNSYLLNQPVTLGKAKVCIAESQSSGRGRRGNDWQSAPQKNIMLSLSWGFAQWPETLTGLGLAVALVVAERLNRDYAIDVGIKWPNDLLVGDSKLAGVLLDVTGNVDAECNVVIGLGLNVHQADWSKTEADYAWVDLHSLGFNIDRNELVGRIVADFVMMLRDFQDHGFAPLTQRWNALSKYSNKQVAVGELGSDDAIIGQMLGVNDVGALIIEAADNKQHIITNSNLSLRLVT